MLFSRACSRAEEMGTMKLIDALPANLIWIYKLD